MRGSTCASQAKAESTASYNKNNMHFVTLDVQKKHGQLQQEQHALDVQKKHGQLQQEQHALDVQKKHGPLQQEQHALDVQKSHDGYNMAHALGLKCKRARSMIDKDRLEFIVRLP